jgi:hypothetical protein
MSFPTCALCKQTITNQLYVATAFNRFGQSVAVHHRCRAVIVKAGKHGAGYERTLQPEERQGPYFAKPPFKLAV